MEHIYAPWRYNYVTDEKVKGVFFVILVKT